MKEELPTDSYKKEVKQEKLLKIPLFIFLPSPSPYHLFTASTLTPETLIVRRYPREAHHYASTLLYIHSSKGDICSSTHRTNTQEGGVILMNRMWLMGLKNEGRGRRVLINMPGWGGEGESQMDCDWLIWRCCLRREWLRGCLLRPEWLGCEAGRGWDGRGEGVVIVEGLKWREVWEENEWGQDYRRRKGRGGGNEGEIWREVGLKVTEV